MRHAIRLLGHVKQMAGVLGGTAIPLPVGGGFGWMEAALWELDVSALLFLTLSPLLFMSPLQSDEYIRYSWVDQRYKHSDCMQLRGYLFPFLSPFLLWEEKVTIVNCTRRLPH